MKKYSTFKKYFLVSAFVLCSTFFAACGKDNTAELEAYKTDLQTIYNEINTTAVSINSIDINQPGAEKKLLEYMDIMVNEITSLKDLNEPAGYEAIDSYATEALSSITQSSYMFHQIYDADDFVNFNETTADQAINLYSNTMEKLNQIGTTLMGNSTSTNSVPNTESENTVSAN